MGIIFLLVFLLRRILFLRFFGQVKMLLFEAFMYTVMAAWMFAGTAQIQWLAYVVGALCIWLAIDSAKLYVKADKLEKEIDGETRKSDHP